MITDGSRPAIDRAMWSGERRGVQLDGRFYRLGGVHPGPAPAHPIPIWIGANKPRALALTGRIGDGWVSPLMTYKPLFEAAGANRVIDLAATEAGRKPATTLITEVAPAVRTKVAEARARSPRKARTRRRRQLS